MNPAKRRPAVSESLWLRLLEQHGISALFAVVLLGVMIKGADHHFEFLRKQAAQMELQTRSLEVIAETTRRSSESNMRQEKLLQEVEENLDDGIGKSTRAHEDILNKLKDFHP